MLNWVHDKGVSATSMRRCRLTRRNLLNDSFSLHVVQVPLRYNNYRNQLVMVRFEFSAKTRWCLGHRLNGRMVVNSNFLTCSTSVNSTTAFSGALCSSASFSSSEVRRIFESGVNNTAIVLPGTMCGFLTDSETGPAIVTPLRLPSVFEVPRTINTVEVLGKPCIVLAILL